MHVLVLRHHGTWLAGDMAPEDRREAESLFHLLESALTDVAISLALFEHAQEASRAEAALERENRGRPDIAEQIVRARYEVALSAEKDPKTTWSMAMATSEQLRAEVQLARWEAGEVPRSYRDRFPFLYAKAFTYALDTIAKTLRTLRNLEGAPRAAGAACDAFDQAFPQLVHVRNSAHHPEDRVRGKGPKGQPIALQPLVNDVINAPGGGVLVVDQLINNRYGGTLADGSYGEVEVSLRSATLAQHAVQAALDAWPWRGWPRTEPS
jgi:hypothetical protein